MRHITLDTETTGIGPKDHRIVEMAAVEFDPQTGELGRTFRTLVNPLRPVPEEAIRVHGLRDEDLAGAPPFPEAVPSLLEFIAGARTVIHNAPFDVGFLDAELKRAERVAFGEIVAGVVDTLPLARRAHPRGRHNLDALCDRYGIDRSTRVMHGALTDCALLAAVYPALARDAATVTDALSGLLAAPLGSALPDDVTDAVQRFFAVKGLTGILAAEEEKLREHIRALTGGAPVSGPGYEVSYGTRNTTDWQKVARQVLKGIDLAPYQKSSSVQYINEAN